MDHDHDLSALRELLALKRDELPADTQVDQFLVEFHRRQRAQLLVPQSALARAASWMKETLSGIELMPALSYGTAFAAIAIVAFVSLPQQAGVAPATGTTSGLAFQMTHQDASFAMLPSFTPASTRATDSANVASSRADAGTTRFVLANNTHAYDSTVAF